MSNAPRHLKTTIVALTCAILSLPITAFASFPDVPAKNLHYNAITTLEKQGLIKGYSDGTFKPDKEITRAELIKLVFNHIGYFAPEAMYETKYSDVNSTSWFAPYVKKALEIGVISINPDIPLFYPEAPITKIEALRIILPVEGVSAPYLTEGSIIFTDVKSSSLYGYLVRAAQNSGLYTKEDGPLLFPFKNLTRGETAELLYRSQIYRESLPTGVFFTAPADQPDYLTDTEARFFENPKFPILLSVWSKINEDYIDRDQLDKNDLVYGAIGGMVGTLDDPYSIFENPDQAKAIEDELEGTYEGIGTVLDAYDKNYIIVSVLKDSPAEKAGVQAGDIITKINETDITGLEIEQVIDLIKGPSGTSVTLTVLRDSRTLTFKITREVLQLDSVVPETDTIVVIPDNIAYISIYQFTASTSDEFEQIFKTALEKKPTGMILDLRDNPGGYLDAAYKILGHFLSKGKTMINLDMGGNLRPQLSTGKGEFAAAKIPLIVMVNGNSASSAEVVAGALQDYKIGRLLGEQTYGKGTVQEITTYTDGSFFKLSIAKWLTPLKQDINKIGLTPDIKVERTKDDLLNKTDSQLTRAITELQK